MSDGIGRRERIDFVMFVFSVLKFEDFGLVFDIFLFLFILFC